MSYIKTPLLFFIYLLISIVISAQNYSVDTLSRIKIEGIDHYIHKVEKGEGLYRIAKNFHVSQEEILKANPLVADGLKVGQIIYIPIIGGRNSNIKNVTEASTFIYHTIEKGQTSYYLSRKYHVTLDQIYKYNPESKRALRVGQVVKIPSSKKVTSAPLVVNSNEYFIHTVSPKETVYSISKKYNISVQELIDENPGVANGLISIGSQLRIPLQIGIVTQKASRVEEQKLSDQSFYYHNVNSGETIFSIAQLYNVSVEEINIANSGIDQSQLPIGYVIRIPKVQPLQDKSLLESDALKRHKVARKETLFGIARKYNTDIDIIKKLNPTVDFSNLKKGTILIAPTTQWMNQYYASLHIEEEKKPLEVVQEMIHVDCDSYNYIEKRETFNIAVLLPFNVDEVLGNSESSDVRSQTISGRTKIVLEFYEGLLMGLEVFKNNGVNIRLNVFDTGDDISKLQEILSKPELQKMNLIIGPAHANHLKYVSEFSAQHQIKMVNPFTSGNSQLKVNPYMFQMTTPDTLLIDKISEEIVKEGKHKKVVVFRSNNRDDHYENQLTEQVKGQLFWNSFQNNQHLNMVDVQFEDMKIGEVESVLKSDEPILVVIPSVNEVYVNQVINTLNALYEKGLKNFSLVGLPNWLKFQTIDPEYIHRMEGKFYSTFGVDYSSPKTKQYIEDYQLLFHTDPVAFYPFFQKSSSASGYSRYAIWGYDISTYFVGALKEYGIDFETCIDSYQPTLMQSNFHFERISNWGGFYNDGLIQIRFSRDYSVSCKRLSNK